MGFVFDIPAEMQALYGVRADQFELKRQALSKTGSEFWKQDSDGRWYFMPVVLGGVPLWNPIMRVTGRKTVVETPLTERPGSVKEIISLDDYVINIRGLIKRSVVDSKGVIKSGDEQWPEEEVRQLKALYERNEAVDIESVMTNILLNGRDESVVITNLTFPEKRGQSVVAYELEMVTDTSFDLEIDS